nr:reverse transcriptase domain-containing protein [Tanacetum cinerariifolium]
MNGGGIGTKGRSRTIPLRVVMDFSSPFRLAMVLLGRDPEPEVEVVFIWKKTSHHILEFITGNVNLPTGTKTSLAIPTDVQIARLASSRVIRVEISSGKPNFFPTESGIKLMLPPKLARALHLSSLKPHGMRNFPRSLSLPELISTRMTLELANRAICTSVGIARDVFVPVGKFTFPADFVIVDYESDPRVLLILGRPFLRTARALIDEEKKTAGGSSGPSLPPRKLWADYDTSGAGASTGRKSVAVLQGLLERNTLHVERAAKRFVLLSDSSHHSSTNAADDEVNFIVRSSMTPPPILIVAIATTITADATSTLWTECDSFRAWVRGYRDCGRGLPSADLRRMDYKQLFVEFNVGATRQTCLSSEVKLRLEHELREVEAAEAIRLRGQVATVEAAEAARITKLTQDLSKFQLSCDELSVKAASLEFETYKLGGQVSNIEATCSELRDKVLRYKPFKEQIEADGLIAGIDHGKARRGFVGVATYNPSVKANYLSSINTLRVIDFPLLAQLESHKDASMADIMDLLCLEGHAAKTLEAS